ncbi:hypothetical protein Y032_0352g3285 [Ancylostoma ceylanicum]|uniref:Uncharacterized protein n=1 Tax=Ancylostoma ceylanicum TaxID=53326 RepID=A0A016RXP0_9BILA|nr:hypothetical protein Y032_0352g3285 [Ancylostoma ceylanicum]
MMMHAMDILVHMRSAVTLCSSESVERHYHDGGLGSNSISPSVFQWTHILYSEVPEIMSRRNFHWNEDGSYEAVYPTPIY